MRNSGNALYFNLNVFAVISLVFSIWALSYSLRNYFLSRSTFEKIKYFNPGKPLPSRFVINEEYLSPVVNQANRGTCWIFQLIAILESQYKQQGLKYGFIDKGQYLKLSVESLGKIMVEKCMSDPNCTGTPRRDNTTTGGNIDEFLSFLKKYPEIKKSIVPQSCCPYQSDPKLEMVCPPEYPSCIASNPLEFVVNRSFSTSNIRDAKQRIIETNVPVAIGILMPMQRYLFPCDLPFVKDHNSCKKKDHPCGNGFCAYVDFKLFKITDVDFIFHSPNITIPGSGHAMLVVGYNDDFVAKRNVNFTKRQDTKGGFIVRNSWGFRGHTLEYLRGDLNEDQEARICPNKQNVLRWIPATLDCIQNKKDPRLCSKDIRLIRGNLTMDHADELICVNSSHCDETKRYALLRKGDDPNPTLEFTSEGVPVTNVIQWSDDQEPHIIRVNSLPIQHLYYAFRIKDSAENTEGRCGYVFLPYESMEELYRSRFSSYTAGSWDIQGLEVIWKNSSFKKYGKGGDYANIDKSMSEFGVLKPKSPVDFIL